MPAGSRRKSSKRSTRSSSKPAEASPPSTWTRDAGGNFVNWLDERYRKGGYVDFRLEGEADITMAQLAQRIDEYTKLSMREVRLGKIRRAIGLA